MFAVTHGHESGGNRNADAANGSGVFDAPDEVIHDFADQRGEVDIERGG